MSESNEKKDGSCCTTGSSCGCGCKKLIIGILLGVVLTMVGMCLFKGGMCGSSPKMCPITLQAPAQQ